MLSNLSIIFFPLGLTHWNPEILFLFLPYLPDPSYAPIPISYKLPLALLLFPSVLLTYSYILSSSLPIHPLPSFLILTHFPRYTHPLPTLYLPSSHPKSHPLSSIPLRFQQCTSFSPNSLPPPYLQTWQHTSHSLYG